MNLENLINRNEYFIKALIRYTLAKYPQTAKILTQKFKKLLKLRNSFPNNSKYSSNVLIAYYDTFVNPPT